MNILTMEKLSDFKGVADLLCSQGCDVNALTNKVVIHRN